MLASILRGHLVMVEKFRQFGRLVRSLRKMHHKPTVDKHPVHIDKRQPLRLADFLQNHSHLGLRAAFHLFHFTNL